MTVMDRTQNINAIRALPDVLEGSIRGLSDAQLDTPYRQGGWTIRQVVHHLADSHINAFVRMKLILTEENPALKPYDQDDWARLVDSRLPPASSLAIIRGLHERWAVLLSAVPETSWGRKGLHPERGVVTLESMLETYARHGEKHVEQIMGLRRAKSW